MHARRRSAWLDWLEHRQDLANAADRVLAGNPTPGDRDSLAAAPQTVHRGLHAAEWTTTTPQATAPPELALVA